MDEFEKDKVYLKDQRNGRMYQYESILAKNKNFIAVVPNPSKKEAPKDEAPKENKEPVNETPKNEGSNPQAK